MALESNVMVIYIKSGCMECNANLWIFDESINLTHLCLRFVDQIRTYGLRQMSCKYT